jgi:asparagine synthetase B (glutamine-hydrolysing)
MIGVLGRGEQIQRLELLSRTLPPHCIHKEDGFAVIVISSRPGGENDLQWNEITTDSKAVLAFEGYVYASEKPDISSPGAWLLERYREIGLEAFRNLHGGYAFCLFERGAGKGWMGVCGFGRRDLYYMRENRSTLFSSDLIQLLRLPAQRPGLATDQVPNAFLAGAVYGGGTLLTGVRRALPGAVVVSTETSLEEGPPAPMPEATNEPPTTENEAIEELDSRLHAAVKRLVRIRPATATLMSSGVDSTLIASYVKLATGSVQAITLQMPWPPDESSAAAAIAEAIGASHRISRPSLCDLDLLGQLDGFVQVMEEPTSFGLGLFMMQLARDARSLADGLFCGVSADALFGNPTANPDDTDRNSIFHYIYREISPEHTRLVLKFKQMEPARAVDHLRMQLASDPTHQDRRLPFFLQSGLMIRTAARLARFHDAEAFFPYLDRDVVALAMQLSTKLLGSGKSLLRALAARHYSPELMQRRKVPFTAYPVSRLLAAGLLDPVLDLLGEKRTRERGLYHTQRLCRLIDSYRARKPEPGWHLIVWQLTVFELFCRRFVDHQSPLTELPNHRLHASRLRPSSIEAL